MVTSDRLREGRMGAVRSDEREAVVQGLRHRATGLGSVSNAAATDPMEYDEVVERVADVVETDVSGADERVGRHPGRVLDVVRGTRTAPESEQSADDERVLTYRLLDSATVELLEAYRHEYGGYEFDAEEEGTNAAAGYLFAAAVATAATGAFGDEDPDETRLRLVGRQGWVRASESPVKRGNHRLYAGDGVSFFVDGVVHDALYRRHRQYLDRLRARLEMDSGYRRERRVLEALFDRWERYDGTLYFPGFVDQYRRQHLDDEGPATTVLDRERWEMGAFARGFLDGMSVWSGAQ
jgi:hypothetical protein